MSDFPECVLIVTAEVDAAVEAEWNRWYDTVRLPDALRCPGVQRGRRYVSSGEMTESAAGKTERMARRTYTTIYELNSPDAITTPEFRAMRGWHQFAPYGPVTDAGDRSGPRPTDTRSLIRTGSI